MKASLNWISHFSDISSIISEKGIKDLAHLYSIHTAEIDGIETFSTEGKIVVGKIISAKPHPDSDHLNIVLVDLGTIGTNQIVCGALNVLSAKFVAVATPGTIMKGDFEIKKTKLRGEESNGMICSEDELGLQEARSEGIMKLEDHFEIDLLEKSIGTPFKDLEIELPGIGNRFFSKIEDTIFEIDNKFITNRPDLFSIEGNAREFSAIFDLEFKPYDKRFDFNSCPKKLDVNIQSEKVLAYHLIKLDGVDAKVSPFPISYMLYRSGINSKFNLVDMTNYIMTELGQPMHAFDADKVVGNVSVRNAKDGEEILALNGEKYTLTNEDLVIADDEKVLAIAGVIGGAESAISEGTKNILIESACFDPTSVRLTALRHGVRTDSSTRYEKSLDPLLTYKALSRAIDFLEFLGKDINLISGSEYLNSSKVKNIEIEFNSDFIRKKIGTDINNDKIKAILIKLGFEVTENNDIFNVKVPSWRVTKDISIKEDIAEEIGRIYGYHNISETPMKGDISIRKINQEIEFKKKINAYFAGKGWFEVYNYSFSNEELDEKTGIESHDDAIKIINAYSREYSIMRRYMIGNLISAVAANKTNKNTFKMFEVSKVEGKTSSGFNEQMKIAGIVYAGEFDDFRNDILGFLETISSNEFEIKQGTSLSEIPYLHPNKSGNISDANGNVVGHFGFVNPSVASNFELDDSGLLYFEFDFKSLFSNYLESEVIFKELPKYPGIDREINFVMDEKTPIGDVISEITQIGELIKGVRIIDIYRSEDKLGKDKKSVTFSILLQDSGKTITDEDALVMQEKIIKKLSSKSIELRK